MFQQSYVCRACRLRLGTPRRPKIAQTQRAFSRTTRRKQDSIEDLFQRHPGPSNLQPSRGHLRPRPREDGQPSRVGRYSGRPLQPQQLLDRLDEPQPPRMREHRPAGRSTAEERSQHVTFRSIPLSSDGPPRHQAQQAADVPPQLAELQRRFVDALRTNEPSVTDVWSLVLEIVRKAQRREVSISALGKTQSLTQACKQWKNSFCETWIEDLPSIIRPENTGNQVPPAQPEASALRMLSTCALFRVSYREAALRILWESIRALVEQRATENRHEDALDVQEKALLQELMGIWRLLLFMGLEDIVQGHKVKSDVLASHVHDLSTLDWSNIRTDTALLGLLVHPVEQTGSHTTFMKAMSRLVGIKHEAKSDDGVDTASAAIVTLDLLQTIERRPHDDPDEHAFINKVKPWMQLISDMIKNTELSKPPPSLADRACTISQPALQDYYKSLAQRFGFDLSPSVDEDSITAGSSTQSTSTPTIQQDDVGTADVSLDSTTTDRPESGFQPGQVMPDPLPEYDDSKAAGAGVKLKDRFLYMAIKRLNRAQREGDLKLASKILLDVQAFNEEHKDMQLPIQAYEHLILTFLSLRQFQPALISWKMMVDQGHRPTVKTYSIALRNSQYLKGVDTVQFFWDKMLRDGVQPDVQAWVARIYGLAKKGRPDMALKALVEVGQGWLVAAKAEYLREHPSLKRRSSKAPLVAAEQLTSRYKGDINGVPRPNLFLVNSAISGLATRGGDTDLIPKVLAWGRLFGIEPDIITYNRLLAVSVRSGMQKEALEILRRMKERNVEADSETWTILFNAIFEKGGFEELDPRAQEERIMALISSLENSGAAAIAEKGYGLILDRMLKHYNNPGAAQRVLAHMAERGVQPNEYHYTILMTAYFQQDPPDLKAIQHLWQRIQGDLSGFGRILGTAFYDQMIEGYATHHRLVGTGPMLHFLRRMENEGKLASWRALECLARALAEAGEWERLAQIVDQTRRRLRETGTGGTSPGQHAFWDFVVGTGILRHEGIVEANDIMSANKGTTLTREQLERLI